MKAVLKTEHDENSSKWLSQATPGSVVHIERVDAGQSLKNRLASMGILTDQPIEIIRNDFQGQVVVGVKGVRLVLGRGISQKIKVR